MKTILHVVNISFVIPFFLGEQLNWFSKKGYKEYIICSPSEELETLSEQYNFQYNAIEILRKISLLKDIKAIALTCRYIKKVKPDVVTGHTPKGGLIAMISAFIMKVPVRIYFRHGLVYETSKGIKRMLLINVDRLSSKLSTKIICVSPSVAHLSTKDRLNPPSKQELLSNGTCNGIDINRFNRNALKQDKLSDLRERLGINKEDYVIGFTGRLVKDKGIIELFGAYQKLKELHHNLRLLLVGMTESRDALPEDVIDGINEDNRVIKTGYVSFSHIEYYYALMDVFALPSYREGFPTSILEASSMEIPVITTRATGCCDSIIEGVTGFFANHDANELAEAFEKLYKDASLRRRMGENGRRFVTENFDQETIWKEIEKLYL